jgi:L-threonylcarbamoyladenylate synthase
MITEVISASHPVAMDHAVDVLNNGGLVAFPTDTVYGLAALPFREEYIDRLYFAKGRDSAQAIGVLIGSLAELDRVSKSPGETAMRLAMKFWPGPLTLIVPRHPDLPDALSLQPTIGVRVPAHSVALNLLRLAGPLAVTSANISGAENTTTASETLAQLGGRVHLVIDGGSSPGGIPSTVVDCTSPELTILRQGPVLLEELYASLESA